MAGWGKDGSFYKDDNELHKADNRWIQQEEQRKALEKQNRIMQEQNQAIEYQNRLIEKQMNEQRERDEEQRILEIHRQIELERQTLIEKEKLFIETLDENKIKLYRGYKEVLDKGNRILENAIKIKEENINNKFNMILNLNQLLSKSTRVGFWKFMIKNILIGILSILLMYELMSFKVSENISMIPLGVYIIYSIISCIDYTKKHHNINKLSKSIRKFGKQYDVFNTIKDIEEIEYIHQIGFDGIDDYIKSVNEYCKKILEVDEQITNEEERIKKEIKDEEDNLKAIYNKKKKKLDNSSNDPINTK